MPDEHDVVGQDHQGHVAVLAVVGPAAQGRPEAALHGAKDRLDLPALTVGGGVRFRSIGWRRSCRSSSSTIRGDLLVVLIANTTHQLPAQATVNTRLFYGASLLPLSSFLSFSSFPRTIEPGSDCWDGLAAVWNRAPARIQFSQPALLADRSTLTRASRRTVGRFATAFLY